MSDKRECARRITPSRRILRHLAEQAGGTVTWFPLEIVCGSLRSVLGRLIARGLVEEIRPTEEVGMMRWRITDAGRDAIKDQCP